MLRKTLLAAAAVASLGIVALAPTSASAHWRGGWYGGHGHFQIYSGGYGYRGYDSCYRKRVFYTDYGPVWKWVNVCAY